jgi:protein O-mannosyl-transferase
VNDLRSPAFPAWMRWISPLILFLLVLGVFTPLLKCDFVDWDDRETIALNPIFNPPSLQGIAHCWSLSNPQRSLYVPLTYTMWGILAKISLRHEPDEIGITLSAAKFHMANILMHAAGAVIVLWMLRRLVRDEFAAVAGAVIFAIHPIQVEAIGWASGGKDVLSGLLSLIALWMYMDFTRRTGQARAIRSWRWGSYAIATAAFVGAMLAKPQAVVVPLVAMVLSLLLPRGDPRRALPWLILAIPIAVIGRHVQPAVQVVSPMLFRPVVALDALAFYFGKLVWPFRLTVDYGRNPLWLMQSPDRFLTWIIPVIALALCVRYLRRSPWMLVGMLMFVASLLPVLGLVPFEFQQYSTVGDHYLYLAMFAVALMLAHALARLRTANWIAPAAIVLIVLIILTIRQTFYWQNTPQLFGHALEVNPTSLAANSTLAYYWVEHHDDERAAHYFDQAARAHPEAAVNHFDYANLLRRNGLLDPALEEYRQAVALEPRNVAFLMNYGVALEMANQPDPAIAAFEKAAEIDPENVDALQNAGMALVKAGRAQQARPYLQRALELNPSRTQVRQILDSLPPASASGP